MDTLFCSYYDKGIQISFKVEDSTFFVVGFFFYKNSEEYKKYTTFAGSTLEGIDFETSASEVKDTYENPTENLKGENWERIEYIGGGFRFKDEEMVSIHGPLGTIAQKFTISISCNVYPNFGIFHAMFLLKMEVYGKNGNCRKGIFFQ